MSTNKIIFIILWAILLIWVLYLSFWLNSTKTPTNTRLAPGDISVWIVDDNADDFSDYLEEFKNSDPKYAGKNFVIESFSQWDVYYNTLVSATLSGQAPDIFVLDNREASPLQNQIIGIDPEKISPNNFRVRFQPVFAEDLIVWDSEDESLEFLKGVPLGYEALGIFYSRKFFLRPSELETWTDFTTEIRNISQKQSQVIPLALWDAQIPHVADIMSSFFVASGDTSIYDTERNQARSLLSLYTSFNTRSGDNKYELLTTSFQGKDVVEYFTQGDVAGIIWYPRDLEKIAKIGYQKSFLFASPFPQFAGNDKKTAIKYNYFVGNKDSVNPDLVQDLLSFMATSEGQQAYNDIFPYYISPELSIFSQNLEKKINPDYNLVYKNFVSEVTELVSYDMWSVSSFNMQIKEILQEESGYDRLFWEMKDRIVCATAKQTTLLNLSSSCE